MDYVDKTVIFITPILNTLKLTAGEKLFVSLISERMSIVMAKIIAERSGALFTQHFSLE